MIKIDCEQENKITLVIIQYTTDLFLAKEKSFKSISDLLNETDSDVFNFIYSLNNYSRYFDNNNILNKIGLKYNYISFPKIWGDKVFIIDDIDIEHEISCQLHLTDNIDVPDEILKFIPPIENKLDFSFIFNIKKLALPFNELYFVIERT